MARGKPHIPTVPDDISCGWLTQTLRDGGHLGPDVNVTGLRLEALGGGTGLSGEVIRVHISYSGPSDGAPASVVAKFPTIDRTNRGMIEGLNVYEREIVFYRDVAHTVPVPTPRYFGSAMDPARPDPVSPRAKAMIEKMGPRVQVAVTRDPAKFLRPTNRRFALLIEDLGDDVTVYDLADPPQPDQLVSVFDLLAQLHAHFWGHPRLASMRGADVITDTPVTQTNVFLERGVAEVIQRFEQPEIADLLTECGERFIDDVARLNRPMTLTHNDTRSDNFLYFADGSVRIVDWAMTTAADPGTDLGISLTTCVRPEAGREAGIELVKGYVESLARHGVDYPFDELWESVEAAARAMVVTQGLGLLFFTEEAYGDGMTMSDHWIPRALAILGA